jgi:hypothetical protein
MAQDINAPQRFSCRERPTTVMAAGVIWVVFGCLILVNMAVNLALTAGKAQAPGGVCTGWLAILFGAGFIHVGVQSIRGTARDTLGNGIGSIIFALLNGGIGALLVLAAAALGGADALGPAIIGAINLLSSIGLLVAGVLALVGREDYKAWRQSEKSRRKALEAEGK